MEITVMQLKVQKRILVLGSFISMSKGRQGYQIYLDMSLFKYLNHKLYYAHVHILS